MVNPNFEDPLVPEIVTKYTENKINILKQPSYGLNNMLFNYLYNIFKKSIFCLFFFYFLVVKIKMKINKMKKMKIMTIKKKMKIIIMMKKRNIENIEEDPIEQEQKFISENKNLINYIIIKYIKKLQIYDELVIINNKDDD
jgi:hypothetical protein